MERELLLRAKAGDLDALAELLDRHGPAVRAAVRRQLSEAGRALLGEDDVLQVTYLEAFLRIAAFEGDTPASFGAWLGTIARHNLLDGLRALGREKRPDERRRVTGDAAADLLAELSARATTPSRAAARSEAREMIEACLARLPADYVRVVRLVDLEGRSIPEAARALERSPGAVHMLRARAHQSLREKLGAPERFLTRPG